MEQTKNIKLNRAKDLLASNNFREAFELLKGIERKELEPGQLALYYLIYAEIKINLGEYDIEHHLQFTIQYFMENRNDLELAEAKQLHGWFLLAKGLFFDAREALLESYIIYKRLADFPRQARVLNRLGFLCVHLGELESATNYMNKCITIYNDLGDHVRKAIISMNLAAIYASVGGVNKAKTIFTQIEVDIPTWNDSRNIAVYFLQSALPHALLGEVPKAKKQIDKSLNYVTDFPREQAIYYENLGWIHLLEGDYHSAEKALLQGLKISLDIAPKSALISQIKRRLADAYLGLHQYEKARKYADEALVVAKNINERVEIAACQKVYTQLEAIDGNHTAAREWFQKACEMFSMISSRYELAATRYLAATTGAYHNGQRQALLYLAREYFESEEVTHYVEKIDREIERGRRQSMPHRPADNGHPPAIIAVNRGMKKLLDLAEHIAASDMAVLLTGPTGSGKDLLARFIHYHSGRSGKFIPVNAAAIPDQMVESELFGYKKGAYTGADQATGGLIEYADGGTFYLNEVADASPEMQAKLLDVIENRTLRRLGEREQRRIDFRIIAATNHDLEQMIRDGKFRADLYHRLNEIPITLPSLSARVEDIPALLMHFLAMFDAKIDGDEDEAKIKRLAEVLSNRDWPGNIRQFEAEVKRLALTTQGDFDRMITAAAEFADLSDREQLLIALQRTGWNRTEAARLLGVSEGTIRNRIKKLGITTPTT